MEIYRNSERETRDSHVEKRGGDGAERERMDAGEWTGRNYEKKLR